MRSCVVEARGNFEVGVAETLVTDNEALILVSFIGHRVEVGDDACDSLVVTLLICGKGI